MLIYDQPDFSNLAVEMLLNASLEEIVFDGALHEFFTTQVNLWGVILVGRYRHLGQCDSMIYYKKQEDEESEVLTFTVETNLAV